MAIASQMPEHTLLLRERTMLIQQRIAEVLRVLADGSDDDDLRAIFAGSLNNLANRLSALGRREAALRRPRRRWRSAASWRKHGPTRTGPTSRCRSTTWPTGLSALGRREAALEAAEEAVAIRRELAAARPDAFRPDLAMSLDNLANRLERSRPARGGAGGGRGGGGDPPRAGDSTARRVPARPRERRSTTWPTV